jgi:hypothetical protein
LMHVAGVCSVVGDTAARYRAAPTRTWGNAGPGHVPASPGTRSIREAAPQAPRCRCDVGQAWWMPHSPCPVRTIRAKYSSRRFAMHRTPTGVIRPGVTVRVRPLRVILCCGPAAAHHDVHQSPIQDERQDAPTGEHGPSNSRGDDGGDHPDLEPRWADGDRPRPGRRPGHRAIRDAPGARRPPGGGVPGWHPLPDWCRPPAVAGRRISASPAAVSFALGQEWSAFSCESGAPGPHIGRGGEAERAGRPGGVRQ